ncbi:glycosyltransferase [Serratia quinivorans]|uniref:glycosyltransferase n=1 Tax=Serratia quinivorans TaxID=137545 RepID=UPI002177797D|nr:glycosyltransferase [Serratia quinivorans]CAI0798196.1 Glycogen synthase [Serratia quinivorans]CAI1905920.1 Glycogen synthase [Serratia quinivorans]
MKILHAAETIKGGVASVMRQLVANQLEPVNNNDVLCIVPQDQCEELKNIDVQYLVPYRRNGRGLSSFINFFFVFVKTVFKEKPDIVHLHSTFSGVIGRIALILLRPFWCPKVVYCPHAFSFLMQSSEKKRKIYSIIERFFAKYTDAIICVSEYEKTKAVEAGLPPEKLRVVHNGVSKQETKLTHVNPYSADVCNVLFVGRFDFQKGFDILAEVMRSLEGKPFHLTAVGGAVHDENFNVGIMPQTTFTGWLDSDAMAPYFTYADVLVMPSRWEGFGMVPLEAMSYGLPVMATNCTSLPEVVKDNINGFLFEMQNAQEIVERLINTPSDRWSSMGIEAQKTFLDNFTADKMIYATLGIYKELLHEKF